MKDDAKAIRDRLTYLECRMGNLERQVEANRVNEAEDRARMYLRLVRSLREDERVIVEALSRQRPDLLPQSSHGQRFINWQHIAEALKRYDEIRGRSSWWGRVFSRNRKGAR